MFTPLSNIYTPNQLSILQQIRQHSAVTRAELSRLSGLQLLTVTKTVSRLLEDGLILESGSSESTGGRKARLLSLNPHCSYTLAAIVGSSCTRVGVIGMDGRVLEYEQIDNPTLRIPADYITPEEVREKLASLAAKYGREKSLGIGMAFAGTVRHSLGKTVYLPNLKGWNDIDTVEFFGKTLGLPVEADTLSRAMVLAEAAFGAGRGIRDQIFIGVGNSIGAGIILNGELFRGFNEFAGEIGHNMVRNTDKLCTCGGIGCLELYVTRNAILENISLALEDSSSYALRGAARDELNYFYPEDVRRAFLQGDKLTLSVLEDAANLLGQSIARLVNTLNPQLVVLGGTVFDLFPELVPDVERSVRRHALVNNQENFSLRVSALGPTSSLVGAGLQVINKYLG